MLKRTFSGMSLLFLALMLVSGCVENTDLSLRLPANSAVTQKYTQENIKEVKLEKSGSKKSDDKISKSYFELVFDQKIVDVKKDGSAVADITIKEMKYKSSSPKGVIMDFDSTKDSDKVKPLAKIIGKTYQIKLDSKSQAELITPVKLDIHGMAGRIAKKIFDADSIAKIHSIKALEKAPAIDSMAVGTKWTVQERSPKGMMQSRKYEKIYELESVQADDAGGKIATVKMTTIPGEGSAGAGMFAMFGDKIDADFKDSYNGVLKVDAETGNTLKYTENLEAVWTAIDNSKKSKNKMPDILTISFIKKFCLETLGSPKK